MELHSRPGLSQGLWLQGGNIPAQSSCPHHVDIYGPASCRVLGALAHSGDSPYSQPQLGRTPLQTSFFTSVPPSVKRDGNVTHLIELLGGCNSAHVLSASTSFWHIVGALYMLVVFTNVISGGFNVVPFSGVSFF